MDEDRYRFVVDAPLVARVSTRFVHANGDLDLSSNAFASLDFSAVPATIAGTVSVSNNPGSAAMLMACRAALGASKCA